MTQKVNDLKRQIVEKNLILNSMDMNAKHHKNEITMVKAELDRLLYQYYKCYKCS